MAFVYKWSFPFEGLKNNILLEDIPIGSQILSVGNQDECLCVWALLKENKHRYTRTIRVSGLEHPLCFRDSDKGRFLGTVMFGGGKFPLHVFEG